MTPGYYKDLFNMLRELTIRAVESVPADKMDYQPPNSRSLADIALHLAEASISIVNKVTGRPEPSKDDFSRTRHSTQKAIVELLRTGQRDIVEALNKLDPKVLEKVGPSPMGPEGPMESWLSILLIHESDHKGNLIMMAKTLGANPPDVRALRTEQAAAR